MVDRVKFVLPDESWRRVSVILRDELCRHEWRHKAFLLRLKLASIVFLVILHHVDGAWHLVGVKGSTPGTGHGATHVCRRTELRRVATARLRRHSRA